MSLYRFDRSQCPEKGHALLGVDEAGRGPLAGPVVAAAVQLDLSAPIEGVNDSKKLTALRRERLYEAITRQAVHWGVGVATPEEIDRLNILEATFRAMQRALQSVQCAAGLILVDGNRTIKGVAEPRQRAVVEGDGRSASIAAASIIAKVTRDRMMRKYHDRFPLYGFDSHKGYATRQHREAIVTHGLCAIHRRSFCADLAAQTRLAL